MNSNFFSAFKVLDLNEGPDGIKHRELRVEDDHRVCTELT